MLSRLPRASSQAYEQLHTFQPNLSNDTVVMLEQPQYVAQEPAPGTQQQLLDVLDALKARDAGSLLEGPVAAGSGGNGSLSPVTGGQWLAVAASRQTLQPSLGRNSHRGGLLFTTSLEYARRQHINNLVLLLRQCASTRDQSRLAGLVATLMAVDRATNLSDTWMFRHPTSRVRLAEALEAGWVLLQQQPNTLVYEQTLRYLEHFAGYQLTPAGKEAVQLQLAQFSQEQGHGIDAWDFLSAQDFSTAAMDANRRALMGVIKLNAWQETMHGASVPHLEGPTQASASPNTHRCLEVSSTAAWQPWQYDPRVWARGGRMAKELHQDAVESFQIVLDQRPEAGDVMQMMAQLLVATGDVNGALGIVLLLQKRAPQNADVWALEALLLRVQQAQRGAYTLSLKPVEAADSLCQLLAADPSVHLTAAALLSLHKFQQLTAEQLVAGCCLYLDSQPPSWLPSLLELRVWQHLAGTLIHVAATVLNQTKQLQHVRCRRDLLLPRSLRAVQQHLGKSGLTGVQASQRWQRLQDLTAAATEAHRGVLSAVRVHHACCAVLEGRMWWRDSHLLSQPSSTVLSSICSGVALPAALSALAAVNAFLHPLWQQRIIQKWKMNSAGSGPSRSLRDFMTGCTAAALSTAGYKQEGHALHAAVKTCRRAALATARQGRMNDCCWAVSKQRPDFWRATRAWRRMEG